MATRTGSFPLSRTPWLALILAAGGCATVIHGPRQKVEVFTDPPGATATAVGQSVTTPGVLVLPRRAENLEIRIEKEGYIPRTIVLSRETSDAVWWNFAGTLRDATSRETGWFGGPKAWDGAFLGGDAGPAAGFALDYATGAACRLEPVLVVVKLAPGTVAAASNEEKEAP